MRAPLWPQVYENFPYVDYALALHLLKGYPDASEPLAALIAYLSLASRAGHLCIQIEENKVIPNPKQLFEGRDGVDLTPLIIQGAAALSGRMVSDVHAASFAECPETPVCRFGSLYYLQRYWRQESAVLQHFHSIVGNAPAIALDMQAVDHALQIMLKGCQLLPEQAEAIRKGCTNSLSIICGGPGTGKTYTAGELIKIYWAAMDDQKRQRCEIVLAAPTGKAAANLQKSLRRAVGNLPGFPAIQAKTLHALLGIRSSKPRKEIHLLKADLILVDESSMIDVHLMGYLLAAVKPGARLVMLGDRHQLPPVAAGMLFGDLMAPPNERCTELKTCLRAELHSIVDFAETINRGDSEAALKMLTSGKNGIGRLEIDGSSIKAQQKAIIEKALPYFIDGLHADPHHLLEAFSRFRILSPLRQGPFGVDALNDLFMHRLMHHMRTQEWFVAPILLIANDHRLELSNGEVGVLVRRMPQERGEAMLQEGDYALFLSRDEADVSVRRLPALLLPKFEYAYCLSVHKSQGSEFDRVLLLMPEGAEQFGREVLYTAVTRARKQLDIWGSDATLSATIAQHAHRLSGIPTRLNYKT